jgi:tetratricopeptide (TPR) repeat protein
MPRPDEQVGPFAPPPLAELLAHHLRQLREAASAGFAATGAADEVVPFEAVPVRPADPQAAWSEATAVLRYFAPDADPGPAPSEWPDLVARHDAVTALPFAYGNYAQAVRSLNPLLQAEDLQRLRPQRSNPTVSGNWPCLAEGVAAADFPRALFALGLLRSAHCFDQADELAARCRLAVPAPWRDAWANEEAALAWQAGRAAEAVRRWESLAESTPVLFNRGMAALFTGRPSEARPWLARATDQIPDTSSWHHLGQLYLTLA